MGGGMIVAGGPANRCDAYTGRVTWTVLLTVVVAASGGAMFGYDIGITGGVISMPSWQMKFFPAVYRQQGTSSAYCKLDNQLLQLFTSSMYLAGMAATLCASYLTARFGRRTMMIAAGGMFIIGTILQCAAHQVGMLIVGRLVLGVGVGWANQCVPLYLSEIAPFHWRGACNMAFQMACTIAIWIAGMINWKAAAYSQDANGQGWRFSLGFALIPGSMLFFGSMFLPDSPNSLVERGELKKAREVLQYVRAVENVDAEFDDIVDAARDASVVTNQWAALFTRRYRPQLIICILVPLFQQLTGINCIMFYAPQIFSALGHTEEQSLINTVIIGAVNVAATIVAIALVDIIGRRALYLEGGFQMLAGLICVGTVIGVEFGKSADGNSMPAAADRGVLAAACFFISAFAWSWGPLGWLTPSEIQPMETRSAGMSVAVFTNFLFTFFIGQAFLSMMCGMHYGVYYFFGGFVILMTIFAWLLIPETKGVPIEAIEDTFAEHWFWARVVGLREPRRSADSDPQVEINAASLKEAQLAAAAQ